MYSNSMAEKLQSHILAPVPFCLQGIAWVTPTVHLGNMICASLLTQSKQWLHDFEFPSNNISCFYYCCIWLFQCSSYHRSHVYPAPHALLITSNNTKHNVCVCLCVAFQSKCVSAKTIMASQGEETTFHCSPFFAQCIKKRLRGRTIEEWMFSKQRLTLPAGQALI